MEIEKFYDALFINGGTQINLNLAEPIKMSIVDTIACDDTSDFKDRFKEEYYQVNIRYMNAINALSNHNNVPYESIVYILQQLGLYRMILEKRAEIEEIDVVHLYSNVIANDINTYAYSRMKFSAHSFLQEIPATVTSEYIIMMSTSSNWKDRLFIEHYLTANRLNKLLHMLTLYLDGKLDFIPKCPYDLLRTQAVAMDRYLSELEKIYAVVNPIENSSDADVIRGQESHTFECEPDECDCDGDGKLPQILTWARDEVHRVKDELADDDSMNNYVEYCYDSALKALESLCKDNHSGMSIMFTKEILNRLICNKPLSPIEDNDDEWVETTQEDAFKKYVAKRMCGLYKRVYDDGHIEYYDIDRFLACDINDENGVCFSSSFSFRYGHEIFPITLPYFPDNKAIILFIESFLTNQDNGDFDSYGIYKAQMPNGDKVDVNKFYKETEDGFIEISVEEWNERKEHKVSPKHATVEPESIITGKTYYENTLTAEDSSKI